MTTRIRRARFGALVAVALGALALLALPALSVAKRGSDDTNRHSNGRVNAGTVASYDSQSGALTIDLKKGGTTTALVNDETRIRCVGAKRGGQARHQHRGRGRGHRGEDAAKSSRRGGAKARRGKRRGGNCSDAALSTGAVIRKARTDSEESEESFTKILVEQPKPACDDESDDDVSDDSSSDDRSEEGHAEDDHSDDDHSDDSDDDSSGEDDDTPDQGPGEV